jgi:hypothetical protein
MKSRVCLKEHTWIYHLGFLQSYERGTRGRADI